MINILGNINTHSNLDNLPPTFNILSLIYNTACNLLDTRHIFCAQFLRGDPFRSGFYTKISSVARVNIA